MSRFLDISGLHNKHLSEHAWLFGKGPSLDSFVQRDAGNLRICINESLQRVENPAYFFAHDEKPIQRVAGNWPHNCFAVLQPARAQFALEQGIPRERICVYEKKQTHLGEAIPQKDANSKRNQLIGLSGTVHSAIHFCHLIGSKRVTLVGFDGTGEYAPSLHLQMPVGGGQHGRIRNDSIHLMNKLGIEYDFISPLETQAQIEEATFDYQGLYDKLRTHGYHREEDESSHLAPYVEWIAKNLQPLTALDVGCSSGRSLELLEDFGIRATGVEVSLNAVVKAKQLGRNVVHGSATNLPFDDNSFDLVCSADVFEHLTETDGPRACHEVCRVASQYVFLKIAEKEDVTQQWKDIAGHPLHLTTQPIQWWNEYLVPFGNVIRCESQVICLDVGAT